MKYKFIQQFRNFTVGTIIHENGLGDFETDDHTQGDLSDDMVQTLIDVGYLEETTETTRWTPAMNTTFYHITGAGEIKERVWNGGDFCVGCRDTFGVFQTRELAQDMLNYLKLNVEHYHA